MKSFVCCYNSENKLEHFGVPEPVYDYVRQLEAEIRHGLGNVYLRYPTRFLTKNYMTKLTLPDWPMAQVFTTADEVIATLECAKGDRTQSSTHVAACWIAAQWLQELQKSLKNDH